MSSLLHAKRKLEALVGAVRFAREPMEEDADVQVYIRDGYDMIDWGPDYLGAIEDAHKTLKIRAQQDAAECRGDVIRDARKDER